MPAGLCGWRCDQRSIEMFATASYNVLFRAVHGR